MGKKKIAKTGKKSEYPLRMIMPPFDSDLTQLIIELDYLRLQNEIRGTAPPEMFEQLKRFFFMLESLGSARIEGNHTTILEYAESKIVHSKWSDSLTEIANIENAMSFIEENARSYPLNRMFVSQLHKITVAGLDAFNGEGDRIPGEYRKEAVGIVNASHSPPDAARVPFLMDELLEWINEKRAPRYDLLTAALAHHRFVWIHPFTNGNGRTARLLTYAMLAKYGLTLANGRLVNLTALFCSSRETYYGRLAEADTGTDQALYRWCEYVLGGLKAEVEKVRQLARYGFLSDQVLKPVIKNARQDEIITEAEENILLCAVEKKQIKLSDIKLPKKKTERSTSRYIQSLRDKGMLVSKNEGGRIYRLHFMNNPLLRYMIKALDENGFLPIPMNE